MVTYVVAVNLKQKLSVYVQMSHCLYSFDYSDCKKWVISLIQYIFLYHRWNRFWGITYFRKFKFV